MSEPRERLRDALARARARLGAAGSDAGLEAPLLLGHVLGRGRAWLVAHGDDPFGADDARRFEALIERRAAGEPVAYLLGRREFWSLDLAVTPAVLIPRPDTECLVERALELLAPEREARMCDAGTGSGAVAIAIARERPRVRIVAVERSAAALAVAAGNANRLAPARVALWRGDWLSAMAGACLDLVVANPPYVADADPHLHRGDVRFEPRAALAAGPRGLDAITALADQSPRCLRSGGWLLLEHGADQGGTVRGLLAARGFRDVATRRDLAGLERVTGGKR